MVWKVMYVFMIKSINIVQETSMFGVLTRMELQQAVTVGN